MFTIIGCLGSVVATVDSIDAAVQTVQAQIPLGAKKQRTLINALGKLAAGSEYHVEYGGSGCTVRRS